MHGFHAADEQRADQDQRHAAERSVEVADHSFVAGEHTRHGPHRRGVHAEQIARHIHCTAQLARDGHVDAVIVVRRKVDARERAAAIAIEAAAAEQQEQNDDNDDQCHGVRPPSMHDLTQVTIVSCFAQ